MDQEAKTNNFTTPAAIIIAGIIIAGAVIYSSGDKSSAKPADRFAAQVADSVRDIAGDLRAVSSEDHILGNPDAAVKIVEFSDTECPFCKRFHSTMKQAIEEYGKNGQVAWVYRHFPLDAIHPKARKEAEAAECANELGGNDKFFAYLDRLFEVTPSNNGLDPGELPKIAEYVGLDAARFQSCLESGRYAQHVADDLADAQNSGGNGTPWSVVIASSGKKFPLSGAQPYSAVKALVETALQEK